MLFWMVVILGYRRQRNFERVFFFLCLALFLFYGGSLLALNAQIYYSQPPPLLTAFAWTILSAGLCFAPALLIHLHLEYASTRSLTPGTDGSSGRWKRLALTLCYVLVVLLAIKAYRGLAFAQGFDFLLPANSFGKLFGMFMVFQSGALFDSLTVRDNIAFPLSDQPGLTQADMDAYTEKLAKELEVEEVLDKVPSELSTGMKRAVAIARALAQNPQAILYDEPTTMTILADTRDGMNLR